MYFYNNNSEGYLMLKKYLFATVLCSSLVSFSLFAVERERNILQIKTFLKKVNELQPGHNDYMFNYSFNYSFANTKEGYGSIQFLINSKRVKNINVCLEDLKAQLRNDDTWRSKPKQKFFLNVYKNNSSIIRLAKLEMSLMKEGSL